MNEINKLRKRLVCVLLGAFLLIACINVIYNIKCYEEYITYENNRCEQSLELFSHDIHNELDKGKKMLIHFGLNIEKIQMIKNAHSEIDRYLTYEKERRTFEQNLDNYPLLDGLFLYDLKQSVYIGECNNRVDSTVHTEIKENINEIVNHFFSVDNNSWQAININHENYLFYIINIQEIYYGTWISVEEIVEYWKNDGNNEGLHLILDCENRILNQEGNNIKLELNSSEVDINNIEYTQYNRLIQDGTIQLVLLQNRRIIQQIREECIQLIVIIFLLLLGVYAVLWVITKKYVLKEYDEIILRKEFQYQKLELQYLQKQITPHFLNNCLSLIRNLVMLEKNDEAEDTILLLSRYTRGWLDTRMEIFLETEIENVNSYYNLQRMRYEDEIQLNIKIDTALSKAYVPAMIIQTFVENSIKYQEEDSENITINVSVEFINNQNQMKILIEDSGRGFPDQMIEKLSKGEEIIDENGIVHIGISNMLGRLKILYEDKVYYEFQNKKSGGAKISIWIPVHFEKKYIVDGSEDNEKMD